MSVTIPNLWPVASIKIDVLSPIVILRSQATNLANATRGIVTAAIETTPREDGDVMHQFDLVAPALDGYRHRLFIVRHDEAMVYPVYIAATSGNGVYSQSEQDFIEDLSEILRSKKTVSIIHSLLARSNDENGTVVQEDDMDDPFPQNDAA